MISSQAHNLILQELQISPPDYASAKLQSQKLDQMFGYNCEAIENHLLQIHQNEALADQNRQYWYGLELQSLQTPYSEIMAMVQVLNPQPGELWLDLGAAYGRLGLVLGLVRPEVQFKGYESVPQRVAEGQRIFESWKISPESLSCVDLAAENFQLPSADLYFVYDFGSRNDIYVVLEKLRQIAQSRSVRVVARGRGLRNWLYMDFPWLSQIYTPEDFGNWSIFRS